jgi:PAS domain S-box-containing protein
MTGARSPGWLQTTVTTVRELMMKRLEARTLDDDARREIEMALEELDVMWEELEGQAALLVRENERYAEFFEHAPDAYLITDVGGGVREANRAALELLKAPPADVLGHALGEFVADEDRVGFLARTVGATLGETKLSSWRARLQPTQGGACLAEFTVRAIPLRKSGASGLCWLVRPAG